MGEIKIFGYIIIAILCLTAIVTPLMEAFFAYRERLMLSDALYNSCRVATEAGYNDWYMKNINAEVNITAFRDAFAETFAMSFDLDDSPSWTLSANVGTFIFKSNAPNAYNDCEVVLTFDRKPPNPDNKVITVVTAAATSEYKFKNAYMRRVSNIIYAPPRVPYQLKCTRKFTMEVIN